MKRRSFIGALGSLIVVGRASRAEAYRRAPPPPTREQWISGYTSGELEMAQERYGLRFPPDLIELLLDRRPLDGWDWRNDDAGIRRALSHPLDGLLFDLEHNDLWWPEWGERPSSPEERARVLTAVVGAAPRLMPLIAHRYIPETPREVGNPVFSVMQSDVIYYGANLAEYFANEFAYEWGATFNIGSPRRIPFWSDLVERNR